MEGITKKKTRYIDQERDSITVPDIFLVAPQNPGEILSFNGKDEKKS